MKDKTNCTTKIAATDDDANDLALFESFEAGEWTSAPNEAQEIERYRASATKALLKTSV